jgi:Fic family protein
MKRKLQGYLLPFNTGDERYHCFVPHNLPPKPRLQMEGRLQEINERALLALGRLDSLSTLLPDTSLFIYMYVRKEAVLSSQIEGTQSSLSDLLLFESEEAPGVPLNDVQEVSNYVAAMTHGLTRLKEGMPISTRLFREMHQVLLAKGRGSNQTPGEFRKSQNWIGGSRPGDAVFVPPPPNLVPEAMSALEKFVNDDSQRLPILIRASLAHVQFETIHPFLDGNGRLGRLLITLLLCSEEVVEEPLLYLSLYLKSHREQYYDLLQTVRFAGDWEKWVEFFLAGVMDTAANAVETAKNLVQLFQRDKERIKENLGRNAGSALRVHDSIQKFPLASIPNLAVRTGLSRPAVTKSLNLLEKEGVVKEITGGSYAKKYSYHEYLAILSQGTGGS